MYYERFDGISARPRRIAFGYVGGVFEELDSATCDFLERAKRRCDRLVVGLAMLSDKDRSQFLARRRALEALGCVDEISMIQTPADIAYAINELAPSPCLIERRWRNTFFVLADVLVKIEYFDQAYVPA
jgi:hypothetical protein